MLWLHSHLWSKQTNLTAITFLFSDIFIWTLPRRIFFFPFLSTDYTSKNICITFLKEEDMEICGVAVLMFFFFNAVMRWVKSQLAVLRWSQTLRCAMFVFFTLRCSVKWNWSQCWGFWFTFFKPKFDLNLACKLNDLSITSTVPPLITPFETEHLTVCCQSWSFYVS